MSADKTTDQSDYEKLKARFAFIADLDSAQGILQYDSMVFMAAGSMPERSRQIEALATVQHDMLVAPEVGSWLDAAEAGASSLPAADRRNLSLMRRAWLRQTALSSDLVAAVAQLTTEGEAKHAQNYKSADWSIMKDWYAHAFEVKRAVGRVLQEKLGAATIYDALLDSFIPGISGADLNREFGKLEKALPVLIRQAVQKQKSEPAPLPLTGTFPREQQEELFRRVVRAMQFDTNRGRFDVIDAHPCAMGTSADTRFITRIREDDFLSGLYSLIHEAGHAKYEQGLPREWSGQPAGNHRGMGVHETQSRIMEMLAGRTPEFLRFLEKEARNVFNRPDDPALDAGNLGRLLNRVTPSFIRIEADGLTYAAHILLRHKLETSIIDGRLSVDDLPQAWNDGMQRLLGITPPDVSKGCMQDVHWPIGYIGYFPAYTLGDAGAAQLFAAAERARPELRAELEKGNFAPLNEWLDENVRGKGSLLTPDEMFTQATGEPLNFDYYLDKLSFSYLGKSLKDALAAEASTASPAAPKPS